MGSGSIAQSLETGDLIAGEWTLEHFWLQEFGGFCADLPQKQTEVPQHVPLGAHPLPNPNIPRNQVLVVGLQPSSASDSQTFGGEGGGQMWEHC